MLYVTWNCRNAVLAITGRLECWWAFKESVWTSPRWLDNSSDVFEPVTIGTRRSTGVAADERTDRQDAHRTWSFNR